MSKCKYNTALVRLLLPVVKRNKDIYSGTIGTVFFDQLTHLDQLQR